MACIQLDTDVRTGGEACETCDLSRSLDFHGIVRNTCAGDATFVTEGDCLVEEWAIVDLATGDVSVYPERCSDELTRWEVPADDRLEADYHLWGALPAGEYRLRVTFGDGSVRRRDFEVR